MSNAEYLRIFKANVDAVEHLNGDVGVDNQYILQRIMDNNGDVDNPIHVKHAKSTIREEYLAMHFLLHSDNKRYGSLLADVQNDFVCNTDKYPKTLNKAYDMLVNYVNLNKLHMSNDQGTGMSFYQEDAQYGGGGRGGNRSYQSGGRGRGKGRGIGTKGTLTPTEHSESLNYGDQDTSDIGTPNTSNNKTAYFQDASFNICNVEHLVLMHGLPLRWLLIDSCSTTDIFASASLLTNIHVAPQPIWVRCNAGRIQLTHQGCFGSYPYPVWYNPRGVANILSLANVTKHYRVTMDSSNSPMIAVHRQDGTVINFEPSEAGLYKYDLSSHESPLDQMWSMMSAISTVDDCAAKYTKRAYKKAIEARRLQNILMRPTSRKYKEVILEHLRDATVTKADIDVADDIFGPNLGALKGKTTRRPALHVASGIDSIPPDVLKLHQHLTLTIDIMFVNNLPFFVTKSRGIQFTTVEYLKDRRVATINSVLQSVLNLYTSRGLIVDEIFGDYEFEVLRTWHPNLNTTSANEHVPNIERHIRTIKDSTRSTYCMLPFRRLPCIALIHLVHNAIFWLNALPNHKGITRQYSPRYIMTGQHITATKHAIIPFGAYVQAHETHDSNMGHRTMGCICLGPTGNKQGGHYFMSLTSGKRVI